MDVSERVADLIVRELRVCRSRVVPEALIEDDFGCTGFDAEDLMTAFAREFAVDMTGFTFSRHFAPEHPATPWSLAHGLVAWLATGSRGEPSPDPVTVGRLVDVAMRGRWAESDARAT